MSTPEIPSGSSQEQTKVCLPGNNWKTTIVEQKIIEGTDTFPNVQIHFFVNATTAEEFKKWLLDYEILTSTSYVISSTDIKDGERLILKQRLRCHHFTRCKNTFTPSSSNKTRNTNCPSKLIVKIHANKTKYRGKDVKKFTIIKEMPCEIILVVTHNHNPLSADSLRFRKVSNSVKDELLELYHQGHTPGTALEMIKCHIRLNVDDYVTALADRNQCPSYKYCYDLYMKEFRKKYGPLEFDSGAKIFLKNKFEQYNAQQNENCAKLVITGEDDADYVIGICTPIMKRVHKFIEAASQIVFMDSTGTLDRDGSRIFVLLTHSECGGLPLGIIITTSESAAAIKTGFKILQELMGNSIFGGNEAGPTVFMTDDSQSEQKAICETWPQAKHLLCIFHVLQAVFRWLSKAKNCVPKEQQSKFYKDFRNILYARNTEELVTNFNIAVENAKSYPKYLDYLTNYWWPKRESWIKMFRNSLLIKNNHTNNYSESTIRQIKEKIFSRVKAFNVIQMVDFMLTKFEQYTEQKLLDASSNRLRKNPFQRIIKMPSPDILDRITKLSEDIIAIPSESISNLVYLVNMDILICSCSEGTTGAICKHIDWANMLYCTEKYISTIDNVKIREKLYYVATGRACKEDWLTPLTNEKSQLQNENVTSSSSSCSQSMQENVHTVSGELPHEISCMESSAALSQEDMREGFQKKILEITEIFHQHFEKSPSEVSNSVDKMLDTLKKLETPASFTSAVATFGLGTSQRRRGRKIPLQPTAASRRVKHKKKVTSSKS